MASETSPQPGIPYPGNRATPDDVLRLAEQYRAATAALRPLGRPGDPASWAPFRLASIHAIELYLNALLRAHGCATGELRAMHHDLGRRACHPAVTALALRRRTAAHLQALTTDRSYLYARYEPQAVEPYTRMEATLNEVARKVAAVLAPARAAPCSSCPGEDES